MLSRLRHNRVVFMKKKVTSQSRSFKSYQADAAPVLDSQLLLKRCDDSIEAASKLIQEFLDGTQQDLVELDKALTYGDVARVASMAYRIRTTAATLGAQQTCLISRAMEESCRHGHYETLPLHVAQFRHNQISLRNAVDQFCCVEQ